MTPEDSNFSATRDNHPRLLPIRLVLVYPPVAHVAPACSSWPQTVGVNYCTSEGGRQQPGCSRYRQSSYSHHDAQECCIAGTDRNDSGNRSSSVDVRQYCPQCPAWVGSSDNAVPVVHLCVCLPQRGGVLLRVPAGAVVTLARVRRGLVGMPEYDSLAAKQTGPLSHAACKCCNTCR